METQEVTYHAKLNAQHNDGMGYITYVFENLDYEDPDDRYVMCVRFPNWNQVAIELEDVGYLHFRYVIEGVDKWFDGTNFIPYKHTDFIFLKFVHEKPKIIEGEILTD